MGPSRRRTDPEDRRLASDPTRRRLTEREREVVLLVADGLKNLVIARRLGLSTSTVATHIRRVQQRLNLADRAAVAAWVAARRVPGHPEAGLRRLDVFPEAETGPIPPAPPDAARPGAGARPRAPRPSPPP